MKKVTLLLTFVIIILHGIAGATVIQMNEGAYQTPDGWGVIASVNPIDLDHYYYYTWKINDLPFIPKEVNIVFHGIYDWTPEVDLLKLYLKDSADNTNIVWAQYGDGESITIPDWTSTPPLGLGYSDLDLTGWNDPTGGGSPKYDVIFKINGDTLLNYLGNGNSFSIGIDPDCHYWGEKITVEAVPEPTTLILLGSGLIGLAVFRMRKFKK